MRILETRIVHRYCLLFHHPVCMYNAYYTCIYPIICGHAGNQTGLNYTELVFVCRVKFVCRYNMVSVSLVSRTINHVRDSSSCFCLGLVLLRSSCQPAASPIYLYMYVRQESRAAVFISTHDWYAHSLEILTSILSCWSLTRVVLFFSRARAGESKEKETGERVSRVVVGSRPALHDNASLFIFIRHNCRAAVTRVGQRKDCIRRHAAHVAL